VPGASQAGAWRTKHSLLMTNYEPKSPSRRGDDQSDAKLVIVRGPLEWVADPDKPESAAQRRFRELCMNASTPGADGRRNIVGGFVGYGLPEARLADALVAADPNFV